MYAHWPPSEPTVWRLTQGFTRHLSLAHQPHVAWARHVEEAGSLVHYGSVFLTEIFIVKREKLIDVFTYKWFPPPKWSNMVKILLPSDILQTKFHTKQVD